jgi:hypothetical protein
MLTSTKIKMSKRIKQETDGSFTVSVNLKFGDDLSFLEKEERIQEAVNLLGVEATLLALEELDTDGKPVEVAGKQMSSKGKVKKNTKRPTE